MMMRSKTTTEPDLLARLKITSPRAALLFEATGHLGPWTSSEYANAFAHESIVPERPPRPDPPAEVVEAEAAADAARLAFEAATNAWGDAILAWRRHLDTGGRFVVVQGYGVQPADRKGKTLEAEIARLVEARADAEENLQRLRRDATRLRNRWLQTISS